MALARIRAALGPTGTPAFGSLTLPNLTADRLVYTDTDKVLQSVTLGSSMSFSAPTLNTIQDIRTTASPTFAGLTLTGFSGVLQATAGVVSGNAPLNALANMTANKTFNNAAFSLSFNFTNPTNQPTYDGAFEIQASGAFTGDLFHVHQHTGNPGASDLCHFEAEDADVLVLRLSHEGIAGKCLSVDAGAAETASILASGAAMFSGLTLTGASGILRADAGVVSGVAGTVSGLTIGHVLTATGATTFAFQEASGGIALVANTAARLALSSTSDNGDVVYQEDTGNLYFYRELP